MHEKSCSGWQHDILRAARDTHDIRESEWNGVNEKERENIKAAAAHFISFAFYLIFLFCIIPFLFPISERETEREKDIQGWCRNLGWASAQKIHKMLAPSMKISLDGRGRNGNLVKRERHGDDEN